MECSDYRKILDNTFRKLNESVEEVVRILELWKSLRVNKKITILKYNLHNLAI